MKITEVVFFYIIMGFDNFCSVKGFCLYVDEDTADFANVSFLADQSLKITVSVSASQAHAQRDKINKLTHKH